MWDFYPIGDSSQDPGLICGLPELNLSLHCDPLCDSLVSMTMPFPLVRPPVRDSAFHSVTVLSPCRPQVVSPRSYRHSAPLLSQCRPMLLFAVRHCSAVVSHVISPRSYRHSAPLSSQCRPMLLFAVRHCSAVVSLKVLL